MDFRTSLQGLDHAALVETVYLCGRYLSHGLTPETFQHQLDVDVRTYHREKSSAAVLSIMSAIEAEEGRQIDKIDANKRSFYADQLGNYLWEDQEPAADEADVDRALASMTAMS
jgi:hypothetical protein